MDKWIEKIDRHIWEPLRSSNLIGGKRTKMATQEFSDALAIDEVADHTASYGLSRQNASELKTIEPADGSGLADVSELGDATGLADVSELGDAPGLIDGSGLANVSRLAHDETRDDSGEPWAYLEARVRDKLNEILIDSGPLEPILTQLLSVQGKFIRPKMVISSAYTCLPLPEDAESLPEGLEPSAHNVSIQALTSQNLRSGSGFGVSYDRQPEPTQSTVEVITDVAAAFEMVHMASLVHDDIIDGSSQRRGLPVIHSVWGIHSAILTGNYLFARANKTVLNYAHLGIADTLNNAVELMCRGEVAQDSRFYDPFVDMSDYFYQVGRKTAVLMAAACKAGAMAARAPYNVQENLWRFGIRVGTAFQIVDDVLDLVSEQEILGKPVFSDLRRGTLTLPLIYAMEAEIRHDIIRCLSAKAVPSKKVPELRRKLVSGGHIKRAADTAGILLEAARQDLGVLPRSPGREKLWEMLVQLSHKLVSVET